MKKLLLIAACIFSVFNSIGQDIYTYDNDVAGAPIYSDPFLIVFSNLTAIGTVATTPCTYGFSGISGFNLPSYNPSNPCIEVTLTAAPGFSIHVTGFSAGMRCSPTGPPVARFAYSTDGGASWIDDGVDHPVNNAGCSTPSASTTTVGSFPSLCATFPSIIFRIYPFNASGAAGTIQIYGLNITGSVIPTASLITPTITPPGPITFCPGGSVLLTGSIGAGYTYQWRNAGVDIAGETNPTYTATAAGNYSVRILGTGSCVDTAVGVIVSLYAASDTTMTLSGPLSFCTPGSVTLSVPSVAGVIYQWFSTTAGAILGATTNSYNATTSDNYWVEITNTTTFCTTTSTVYTVTATTTPAPVITPAAPATICAGTTLTLSTPSGAGFTYQWSDAGTPIPGATNSTYLAPTTAGTYSITVFVTNGSCSSTSAVRTLTVNAAPTATSVTPAGPVAFCTGGSITLTSTTTGGVTYQWYRNGFTIGGATNTTYNATLAGLYTMRVTSTTNTCFATSNAVTVTVNTLPGAGITPNGAISLCSGSTQTLTRTVAGGVTYQWYRDFIAIPGATNNTYGATTAGTYKIVVTNTATGCFDSSATAAVITVNPLPVAPATSASGATTFCSGVNVTLTAGAVPAGTTYQWYRSGSSIGGATNANYTAAISGSYSVVVINSFGCRDTSAPPIVVTVNPLPSAAVGTSGPTTFCAPGSVDLTASVGGGYTYQWYNTSGAISGETNNTYTATTSDRDSVVITSGAGCVTTTAAIVVNAIPTPAILYTGSASFCTGNSILLTMNVTGAGITYQWKRNTVNIPGANGSSYSANTPGVYTCYVNIVGSCAATTAPVTVTVFAAVPPVVTYDGVHVSTYNFYATYQWYINTVLIPGATTYQAIVYTNGAYRVMVTDTNGCVLLSAEKPVYNVGVNDVNAQNNISIYPNPATSTVHVESPLEMNVTISTIEGKAVLSSKSNKDIDLTSFANGLYMIIVSDDKGNRLKVEKLLKQ